MKELKPKVYGYLEFKSIYPSAENDKLIEDCLSELSALNSFRCIYRKFSEPLEFLRKEPYVSFLSGSRSYYLCAMTLGEETDRRLNDLIESDRKKANIFDSCANVYLEFKAEEYEKTLEKDISYKFAPGYHGSDITDIGRLLAVLEAETIGMKFTKEHKIAPIKSMVGIIGIGNNAKKQCGKCIMLKSCVYRDAGKRCFDL